MEHCIGLFDALVSMEYLRATGHGWVMTRDAIVEVEIVGAWVLSDCGPKLIRELASEAELTDTDVENFKERLVLSLHGPMCLQRQPVDAEATIRILDRIVAFRFEPSGHPDNRPDIRFRRG